MAAFLSAERINELFHALDAELRRTEVTGELYVVGGAVLCLALHARPATRDVDAYFEPAKAVRQAAARVASQHDVPEHWLNDAVKGFLSAHGKFQPFLELPNLRVLIAQPDYLLAMKCLSFRLGAEFQDEADVRFLLRYLNIEKYETALEVIIRYYPRERFPQKAFYALEEILSH
ncbi:MAG TPA: hypothetical protein VGI10_27490 [Polyangiaceae bacterium]|jgi:hypothetical protein